MNLLLTGINGFVGTNLVKSLKDSYTLYGVDIIPDVQDGVTQIYSWNEICQIPKADVVIHLAGKAHDTQNTTAEKDYFDINVGLTKQIFSQFLSSSAGKFIFFSSVKAVADTVTGDELTEEAVPSPQTPYGKSKLEAENYILSQAVPADKKVYILRPCMIHGPGNKGNLNLLYTLVKKGFPYPLGAFDNRRSFVSIRNLRYVIEGIIEQDVSQGIYQVADDEPLATNQLIGLMAGSLNRKPRIWKFNQRLIKGIARMGDRYKFPLNSERLKKLTESYVVSNTKIKKALDIDKMPQTAEEGMRSTLKSFAEKNKIQKNRNKIPVTKQCFHFEF